MKDKIEALKAFRKARDWEQFHTPENLAKSIMIEAAELLENFQWHTVKPDVKNVEEELVDIMSYCYLLIDHFGFDFDRAFAEKLKKNEAKYPADKVRGSSAKYTQYRKGEECE